MDFDNLTPVATSGERITDYWPGKADDRTEGMTVVGEYVGPITFSEGTDEEATLYKLKKGEKVFGVQGYAPIARAFEGIAVGSQVGIRFNGKKKSPKTGRMYNDFEVRAGGPAQKSTVAPQVESAGPIEGTKLDIDDLDIPFN